MEKNRFSCVMLLKFGSNVKSCQRSRPKTLLQNAKYYSVFLAILFWETKRKTKNGKCNGNGKW